MSKKTAKKKAIKIDPELLQACIESERKQAAWEERDKAFRIKIDDRVGDLYMTLTLAAHGRHATELELKIWELLCKHDSVKKFLHGTPEEFVEFSHKHI